jgi:Dihaem cytochrome c
MRTYDTPVRLIAFTFLVGASLGLPARADSDDSDDRGPDHHGHEHREHERRRGEGHREGLGSRVEAATLRATSQWVTYQAECGSCHLAFPPEMLPGRSWTALLSGLDDHFGQVAGIDAPTRQRLEPWLLSNAGPEAPGTPLRITGLRWWVRKHDEVPAAVYRRSTVTSPANCGACHPGANQGAFAEHEVRIPRDAPAPR